MDLFDDADTHQLTINEHYAAAYAAKKEREELAQLRDKYADDSNAEDEDDETDETEDEDGDELTPAMEAAILKTLSRIRRADPSIYEADKNVFQEEEHRSSLHAGRKTQPSTRTRAKSKPITLKDMALDEILNPVDPDEDSEVPLTHAEEQTHLREETIAAFKTGYPGDTTADDKLEEEEEGFLVMRDDPDSNEEQGYKQFLLDEVGEYEIKQALRAPESPAHSNDGRAHRNGTAVQDSSIKDSQKSADDEFLVNYILNRGWIDRSQRHTPTYQEIVSVKSRGQNLVADGAEEDSDFEDVNDRFESSYNFRFEEPNAAVIPTHPRNIPSAVRRQDDSRKQARDRRKAKKESEKVSKQEELKRLKSLKRREIKEKLELLGLASGKDNIQSDQLDLDGDFDPDAYDRQMQVVFDEDDYYVQIEEEKPTWDDDIDIADIVTEAPQDPTDGHSGMSRARKVDFEILDAQTEAGPSRKRKLDEYMDEYFGLDYFDMIGDMPTRFKYTPVQPSSYSLTPAEILLATDAELNSYVGIRKYAPYREEHSERGRSRRLRDLRETLRERDWTRKENGQDTPRKKRKGKKERARLKLLDLDTGASSADDMQKPLSKQVKE